MNSNKAFIPMAFELIFPSIGLPYTEQDVAPFPNFYWGGCQGFAGPDPSTFLNENAIEFKRTSEILLQQKSPSDIAFKRA